MLLLVSTVRGKQLVASCCESSEALGVRAGMSLAHARSLVRGVCVSVAPFAPVEDEKKLQSLARWALRFSPVVAADPPDGLLIDIEGCEHLYGGEHRLVEKLTTSLERLGLSARIAVAPTPGCARAVARFGAQPPNFVSVGTIREALKGLPTAALRIDRSACSALTEMGVERVGQLLDLPRKELAARFGDELLTAIDRTIGRTHEVIEPIRVHTPLEVSHAFDGPVTAIGAILVVTNKLLTDLVGEIKTLRQGVHSLLVEFHRMRLESACVSLELTHPSNNLAHLWSLLRPRLERVNLGYGVEEVLLRAVRVGRVAEEQLTLWPDDSRDEQTTQSASFGELLDQLVYRLGAEAVTHAAPVQTFTPERAFRRVVPNEARAPSTQPVYPASRPSRLLDVTERLRVIALVPEGPPAWFKWRHEEHNVIASVGPERIASSWWGRAPAQTRDYFMVQDELGRWLWVFHDRGSGHWFVHGEWA